MKLQDLKQYGVTERPVAPPRRESTAVQGLLSGDIVSLSGGRSFYREERFHLEHRHGSHLMREVGSVSAQRLGMISKDPELSYVDLRRAVFLDTETTGLGMGVGTYVFLVGAGYLDGETFRVRQFFLGGPQEEIAYLDALDRFLRQFAVIVTFNGKAFDWPLLEGRFARYRRSPPLQDPPHIDLLHPARRIWKRRLPSCALSALETDVLRVQRTQEDVPGYEIPARYFAYLRSGDGSAIEGVFYHNLQDILSLATLSIRVDQVMGDPLSGWLDNGIDIFCVGKIFERAGEYDPAISCYEEALRHQIDREHRAEALMRLGGIQKRLRWWDSAVPTWERMVDEGGGAALIGLVEMAKYYEHVEHDFPSALDTVRQAMSLSELRPGLVSPEEEVELDRRLARLLNRVAGGRGRSRSR